MCERSVAFHDPTGHAFGCEEVAGSSRSNTCELGWRAPVGEMQFGTRGFKACRPGEMLLVFLLHRALVSIGELVCVCLLTTFGRSDTFRGRMQPCTINTLSSATHPSYPATLPHALALPRCRPSRPLLALSFLACAQPDHPPMGLSEPPGIAKAR